MARQLLPLALLWKQSYSYQLRAQSEKDVVCISMPIFEDPEFVDALLENEFFFTEKSTKIGLHFDRRVEYKDSDIARWNSSDRVVVVPDAERVETWKWTGAILGAHVSIWRNLERRWPGECKFALFQSSNMWWVRKGMEGYVREAGYGGFERIPSEPTDWDAYTKLDTKSPFYNEHIATHGMYARGQPEGAFYPFQPVLDFTKEVDSWLLQNGENPTHPMNSILRFAGVAEATWLQSYVLNRLDAYPHNQLEALTHLGEKGQQPLCYRIPTRITVDDVKKVIEHEGAFESMYSVKRVDRNLQDETTKYIVSLAK